MEKMITTKGPQVFIIFIMRNTLPKLRKTFFQFASNLRAKDANILVSGTYSQPKFKLWILIEEQNAENKCSKVICV